MGVNTHHMKKILFLFILAVLLISARNGEEPWAAKNSGKFFKSYEDYKTGKAVEGITILEMGSNKIVVENESTGKKEKIKISEIPNKWFYNARQNNGNYTEHLMRIYQDKILYVMIEGKICYYLNAAVVHWQSYGEKGFSYENMSPLSFYSEGINGDPIEMTNKKFNEWLVAYGLKEQYEQEQSQVKNKQEQLNNDWTLYFKYLRLINEKADGK
jgi:hypothetical protein